MISFPPSHKMQVSLPSWLCTTPSTRGPITPALSCQLRNSQVLVPTSRAEAGQSRQPLVPAEMCILHSGNVLLSNLLPTRPREAQQLLILKLKPSFLPWDAGTSQLWEDLHRFCTSTSLTTSTNHKAGAALDSWLSSQKCLGFILKTDQIL